MLLLHVYKYWREVSTQKEFFDNLLLFYSNNK